jgi:hypothetical protein
MHEPDRNLTSSLALATALLLPGAAAAAPTARGQAGQTLPRPASRVMLPR